MKEVEGFYTELEKKDFSEGHPEIDVNKAYIDILDTLSKINEKEPLKDSNILRLLNIEREAIQFVKTTEEGLKPKMSGKGKNEDGEEVDVEWPDKRYFYKDDYEHVLKRYKETKNIFLKTEFGLFLFYANHLKNNNDVIELLKQIDTLAEQHISKISPDDKNYAALHYYNSIKHVFFIGNSRRKSDEKISAFIDTVAAKSYKRHLEWSLNNNGSMRFILDSTNLIIDYLLLFQSHDLSAVLDKNYIAYLEEAKRNTWGAIYIADVSYKLAKKISNTKYEWQRLSAQQYEALAENADKNSNLAHVTFIEKAIRIYKEIKSQGDVDRLSQLYQKNREDIRLSEIRQSLPDEASVEIFENIKRVVTDGSEADIINELSITTMFRSIVELRAWSEEQAKQTVLTNLFPTSIQDKFGNTVDVYSTAEEKKEFNFLQTYEFNFQIGSQILISLAIEAIKADKLSASGLLDFLSKTWIGQPSVRRTHGRDYSVSHLELIKPGIELLFHELEKWTEDNSYTPNFICATDSLAMKIEYLLREMCYKAGIVTFKPNERDMRIVMEKLFDDLIRDLKPYLREEEYYFITYVMVNKMGLNLRNKIAHGLRDDIEYGIDAPFLILSIILKLAHYKFQQPE
ncbi:MAG: DUF4209 domain-containing protein [Bacteroidia bacterium]|nr:DUF4209 domain-containing protein [Bacteroidia bacterium]MBP7259704.1 DUF4209 domain-containing protein [Bacteroidia bacterium]MBP9179401.1 DUF4209 domain-containing protein [Bacteroidia bacterium]MBP9723345.1 DUF4209 domain-containing protein [Bacteroidia bacterium]